MSTNTYLITYANGTQRTAKGVSIGLSNLNVPLRALRLVGHTAQPSLGYPKHTILSRLVYESPGNFWQTPGNPSQWCKVAANAYYYDGNCRIQYHYMPPSGYWNYLCGSFYYEEDVPVCGGTRCDVLVTTATGNVLRLEGTVNQPCPTWTTTSDNECAENELKCTDLSDPRGFCCIPCDDLNTRIRTLI